MSNKLGVDDLDPGVADGLAYHQVQEGDAWRLDVAKELINIKHGTLVNPDNWSTYDFDNIIYTALRNVTVTQYYLRHLYCNFFSYDGSLLVWNL